MNTNEELSKLEESIDGLTETLTAAVGGEDAMAKAKRDAEDDADEEEVKKLVAEVDSLADELDASLSKVAAQTFEKRVEEFIAQDMSRTKALQKARQAYPDDFARYQNASVGITKSTPAPASTRLANTEFGRLVRNLMTTKSMSGHRAMQEVRKSHPDAFAAYLAGE